MIPQTSRKFEAFRYKYCHQNNCGETLLKNRLASLHERKWAIKRLWKTEVLSRKRVWYMKPRSKTGLYPGSRDWSRNLWRKEVTYETAVKSRNSSCSRWTIVVISFDYRSESTGFVITHFTEYGCRGAKREVDLRRIRSPQITVVWFGRFEKLARKASVATK